MLPIKGISREKKTKKKKLNEKNQRKLQPINNICHLRGSLTSSHWGMFNSIRQYPSALILSHLTHRFTLVLRHYSKCLCCYFFGLFFWKIKPHPCFCLFCYCSQCFFSLPISGILVLLCHEINVRNKSMFCHNVKISENCCCCFCCTAIWYYLFVYMYQKKNMGIWVQGGDCLLFFVLAGLKRRVLYFFVMKIFIYLFFFFLSQINVQFFTSSGGRFLKSVET